MKNLLVWLTSLIFLCGPSLDTLSRHSKPTLTPLFQEDSLEGWETIDGGVWTVNNGVFSGSKASDIDKHCLLVSTRAFADFELSLDDNAIHGNSGFYFRLAPDNNGLGFKGYHAEIEETGKNIGGFYQMEWEWISKPEEELVAQTFKPGDWNTMKVSAKGKDIIIWLNGHKVPETHFDRSTKGKLGFQLHAGENTQNRIKNLIGQLAALRKECKVTESPPLRTGNTLFPPLREFGTFLLDNYTAQPESFTPNSTCS